jgi:hypothetical protein
MNDMLKEEVLELLEHTEQETIFSFIAEYAARDNLFYEKLKEALLPEDNEDESDITYYKDIAEDCFDFSSHFGSRYYGHDFRQAAYDASSGLDKMLSDASFLEKQGKYTNCAAIAMAVAEIIPRKAEEVDDSDGELSDSFDMAIELLCNIVNNENIPSSIKNDIYQWSQKEVYESIYSDYGFDEITTIYKLCCELLGDVDEVLADIDKQIKNAKSEYFKCNAVLWKIRFMQSKNLDAESVIQTHLDLNEVRKIKFRQLIDAKAYDEALRIAEMGIELAKQKYPGLVSDWQKSIFDIYLAKEDATNLLPMAEYLYLNENRWDNSREEYYNILKKYTLPAKWPDTMERLLKGAEKNDFDDFTARIMKEHQLWQRLFTYCKQGDVNDLVKYEIDLKPHFEKDILEIYREHVEKQALITDSRAYREVAQMLKRMRTFTNGNELVDRLLTNYRTIYKRRKNMMVSLQEV